MWIRGVGEGGTSVLRRAAFIIVVPVLNLWFEVLVRVFTCSVFASPSECGFVALISEEHHVLCRAVFL